MLGTILGAGLQLAGGLLGNKAQKDANKRAERQAQQNIALQREFAQNSIQWRTADAHKAGIHPAFALGSPPINFSPVVTGHGATDSLARSLSGMGQDISRSQLARSGPRGRDALMNQKLNELGLERAGLQNELLRTQIKATISRINRDQLPPPLVETKSQQIIPGSPDAGHQDPGVVTDVGFAKTKQGYVPVPSEQVKERIEDILPHEFGHFIRNNVFPNLGLSFDPPKNVPLKKGYRWVWSPSLQGYVQRPKPDWSRLWKGYSSPYPKQ